MATLDILRNFNKVTSFNPLDPLKTVPLAISAVNQAGNLLPETPTTPTPTDAPAPTGVLSDSASVTANFADSIKRGAYTVSNPTNQIPAPVPKSAVVVPTSQVIEPGLRTPNKGTVAGELNRVFDSFTPTVDTTITDTETITTTPAPAGVSSKPMGMNDSKSYFDDKGRKLTGKALSDARKSDIESSTGLVDISSPGVFNSTDAQLAAAKQYELRSLKARDEAALASDRAKSLLTAANNIDTFRKAVGIKPDGSVNLADKNSIAGAIQSDFDVYKAEQNKMTTGYENARKSQVVGTIRARLASSGIDLSKMAPEQVIALSDQVGVAAFNDIYQNKQNTLNAITSKQEAATTKLNDLRAKGVVAEQEYNTIKNSIDSTFEKTKNEINRSYVNDIFGVVETSQAKKEKKSTDAVNTIETFLKNIPSSQAAAFRSRYSSLIESGKTPAQITKAISTDPQYIQWSEFLAKSSQEAEAQKAGLAAAKTRSEITKNMAAANKSATAASKPKATKDTAIPSALLTQLVNLGVSDARTISDLVNVKKSNPAAYQQAFDAYSKTLKPIDQ